MTEQIIGTVTHYFNESGVAVVKLAADELHLGDQLHFAGYTAEFTETVTSMQVDHKKVEHAKPGDEIAIKVIARARPQDRVFKVVEGAAGER